MSKRRPEDPQIVRDVEVLEGDELADAEELDRGRRQLRRGRLARLNDRLAGGAARPGEQEVTRSPFVIGMGFAILGLAIVAGAFYLLIVYSSETRQLENATRALNEARYGEAEQLFRKFLVSYPSGESSDAARVHMHTAGIKKYAEDKQASVNGIVAAEEELNSFIRECRDLPEFKKEDVVRYSKWITNAGAQVAASQSSRKALDASLAAMSHLKNYSDDDSLSARTLNELIGKQRVAEAAILKKQVLSSSLSDIRTTSESGQIMEALRQWQQLGTRYEALRTDTDFLALRDDILQKEQQQISAEQIGRDAITTDFDEPVVPSLSLNLRTQASADQLSQGQLVFGWGGNACYGLDSETGEPAWKRNIGTHSPFPPTVVDAAEPALLTYDTIHDEMMLLHQKDGSVIWRQPFESIPNSPPLILDQQLYITTEAGHLWQLSVEDGRAIARIHFSQPVVGPPALSRDGRSLVLPGREAIAYTVSRRPFECVATSWLGHESGAVAAPIITMGHLFLVCENSSSENARLRTMEFSVETGRLTERDVVTVTGQIFDPCLLRGDQLYVPSTPQRVTAFRVSDQPDAESLSLIGTNQIEDAAFASMYLLPGPGGNLWMASTSLRRFRVTTNSVLLDNAVVAEGQHLYPMRFQGESLYVATNEPSSSSVFLTRVNRSSMQGIWRTVLSTNLVAVGPSETAEAVLAVSDFGEVFRVPLSEVSSEEFHTKSLSRFRLPDGLKDKVGGLELLDGRLAAWCRGQEPAVWTVNKTGHLEQRWPLPGVPEADPIAMADGIVVGLPGRLHMTGVSGRRVADYRASDNLNDQTTWKFLAAISDSQLLAFNSEDQIVRIEYRSSPNPHLTEVGITTLDDTIDVAPAVSGDFLVVATVDGRLMMMKSSTLEIMSEASLQGSPAQPPIIAGNHVFMNIDDQTKVYNLSSNLALTATFANNKADLLAPVLTRSNGRFVAALSDGTVLQLNNDGVPEEIRLHLGQALQRGPINVGDDVIAIGQDGSLFPLNELLTP